MIECEPPAAGRKPSVGISIPRQTDDVSRPSNLDQPGIFLATRAGGPVMSEALEPTMKACNVRNIISTRNWSSRQRQFFDRTLGRFLFDINRRAE